MKNLLKTYALYLSIFLILLSVSFFIFKTINKITYPDNFFPSITYITIGLFGILAVIKNKSKLFLITIGFISLMISLFGIYLIGKQHLFITSAFLNTFFGIKSIISIIISLILGIISLIIASK